MSGLRFAIQALAAYRLTRLVQEDDLPPMPWLRDRMWDRQQKDLDDLLAKLVQCPWCLGFWVSAGVLVADALVPRLWRPLATALALSAVVGHLRVRLD